jgi:hypothetical protein
MGKDSRIIKRRVLWGAAAAFALLVVVAGIRLLQAWQRDSDESVLRGFILVGLFGGCFLICVIAAVRHR